MNIEDYIKGLDPDLQEKARACGSAKELLALAKEAKIPLPDEALAVIAGGDDEPDLESCKKIRCRKCGSTKVTFIDCYHLCENCGFYWQ